MQNWDKIIGRLHLGESLNAQCALDMAVEQTKAVSVNRRRGIFLGGGVEGGRASRRSGVEERHAFNL